MKAILANRQKWNKRGVELTINFIVTLILALAAFALGAVIIKTLTAGGAESIKLTQNQLNDKISQLSCSSRDKICISNNNKAVFGGDVVVTGLAVFNYMSTSLDLTINVIPLRATGKSGSAIQLTDFQLGASATPKMPHSLYSNAPLSVESKTQGQLAIGIATYKETPKGTYIFKVSVTSTQDPNFMPISDLITVTVK